MAWRTSVTLLRVRGKPPRVFPQLAAAGRRLCVYLRLGGLATSPWVVPRSTQNHADVSSRTVSSYRKKTLGSLLLVGKSFSEVASVGPLGPHGLGPPPVPALLLTAAREV